MDDDRRFDADTLFESGSSDSHDSLNCDIENDNIEKDNNDNVAIPPYVGQTFATLFDAEFFYNTYAHKSGFEVKILTSRKHAHSDKLSHRLYACRKAGHPIAKKNPIEDDDEYFIIKRRRDTIERTLCKARMFVVHNTRDDSWRVSTVELTHNHDVVTPSKIDLMATHKTISPVTRQMIETLNAAGVGPSKMMSILSSISGGRTNVALTNKDIGNIVRNIRRDTLDANDAQAALTLLRKLEFESPGKFFFSVKADDDNRIACVLWVDSRSKIAYKNFGDVVTFDTTYRTNRYAMPFVPFTGVNNHHQSILFGFALIKDESEDTFVWVLETWLQAMENKIPVTIITDQDKAMSNAIARVLPETRHLLCTWHISNKYPERLHHIYCQHETFKADFDRCVYSVTIVEFEERWKRMLLDYGLREHKWLRKMYDIKEKWVGAYTKMFFAAGMTTTGRSESMNNFFDEYVNSTTGLKDFVVNSQKAIEKQYLNERRANYQTTHRSRNLRTGTMLEKHGAEIYTKKIFYKFSVEVYEGQKLNCRKIPNFSSSGAKGYCVFNEEVSEDRRSYYVVMKQVGSDYVTCTCQLFEHSGMICRHIVRYFTFKSISKIPTSLICTRWTRNANKVEDEPLYVSPNNTADLVEDQTMRYNHLCRVYLTLAAKGATSRKAYTHALHNAMQELAIIDQMDPDINEEGGSSQQLDEDNEDICNDEDNDADNDELYPPMVSQTKGRKKATRIRSGIEQSKKGKKLRKCAICNEYTDHDKRNHYKAMKKREDVPDSEMQYSDDTDLEDEF